ncbi:MobV family relaxase [Pseudomonas wayambapalatensis]|uniref:MobV family relaxase n=1 Tax=Pseudomonas wayambapalatensis TaxID=485895 RepID=UPI003CF95566
MPYAILRTKKLKTIAGVLGSGRHTFREMPTPNSDGAPGVHICGATNSAELGRAVLTRLPMRRRRDAVLCIEYLITASPEAFKRHGGTMPDTGGYFDQAMIWLSARHGAENIVCAELHLDERTPHLVAYITPLTQDGRLSARDFLGGPAALRRMQTDFHEQCGKPFGLARGIEGSKATHQAVSAYYQALQSSPSMISRSDMLAAAFGIQTPKFKSYLSAIRSITALTELQQSATESIQARNIALTRKADELHARELALESLELSLEKRADQLDRIDRELEMALYRAASERARADKLSSQLAALKALSTDHYALTRRDGFDQ